MKTISWYLLMMKRELLPLKCWIINDSGGNDFFRKHWSWRRVRQRPGSKLPLSATSLTCWCASKRMQWLPSPGWVQAVTILEVQISSLVTLGTFYKSIFAHGIRYYGINLLLGGKWGSLESVDLELKQSIFRVRGRADGSQAILIWPYETVLPGSGAVCSQAWWHIRWGKHSTTSSPFTIQRSFCREVWDLCGTCLVYCHQ